MELDQQEDRHGWLRTEITYHLENCHGRFKPDPSMMDTIEYLFPGGPTYIHPLHAINDGEFNEWLKPIKAIFDGVLIFLERSEGR